MIIKMCIRDRFGSDLDAATKATLEHGQRVREVLKQAQYSPRSVDQQVITCLLYTSESPEFMTEVYLDSHKNYENMHESIINKKTNL